MTDKPDFQPLINHLCESSDLTPLQARKTVDEVIAYFSESPDDYVRRRHLEIKQERGLANPEIFKRIEAELSQLVFAAPPLTQRQIRRIIYG
jgi:hypothetical protein